MLRAKAGRGDLTADVVQRRWAVFGGVPRAVFAKPHVVRERFESLARAALSGKVNAQSVRSLLNRAMMIDAREPTSPPSELVHMWPVDDDLHTQPHLWPASPYAAQLIGIKSFVVGMRSEQWQTDVYERAVVEMLAYGVDVKMVRLRQAPDDGVEQRLQLARRRISREGNTQQDGLDALMRLPWVSELSGSTSTREAPESVSWAEALCLKHLPQQLGAAPWAAELKQVVENMGDRARDGDGEHMGGEAGSQSAAGMQSSIGRGTFGRVWVAGAFVGVRGWVERPTQGWPAGKRFIGGGEVLGYWGLQR